jgi:hypothetical protein
MPTILATDRISLLKLHLLVALATEILRCGTSVVDGGAEGGAGGGAGCGGLARADEEGGDVGFVGCHGWGLVMRFGCGVRGV